MRRFIFNDVINCKGHESYSRLRRPGRLAASFVTETERELKLKATHETSIKSQRFLTKKRLFVSKLIDSV